MLNKFQERGTKYDRKPNSSRPIAVTAAKNEEKVEKLICLQEDSPGTHKSPRQIEKITGIMKTSLRKMVKRNGWKKYKRIKTPRISKRTKQRRTERAGALAERFSHKRSIEKIAFQDERDFTLEVAINHQNSRVRKGG